MLKFSKLCQKLCLIMLIMPFLNYKPIKPSLRVFSAGHTVAMVTCCVTKLVTKLSPMIGRVFDTMIEASRDKEWL